MPAKLNEYLALRYDNAWASIALATGVAGSLAVGLTFFVHSLRGTPEPLYSTLPTLFFAVPGFIALGWRARQRDIAQDQV